MEGARGAAREEGSALRKPTFSPIVRSVGRTSSASQRKARGCGSDFEIPGILNLKIEGRRERAKRIQTPTSGCQARGQNETFGHNFAQNIRNIDYYKYEVFFARGAMSTHNRTIGK